MAYNPVPTVTTGDLWTASNHNTYIRDNFAAGIPDLFQAAGDLVYASGADAAARLPIGLNGYYLKVQSGLPVWGALPTFPNFRFNMVEKTTLFQTSSASYVDVTGLTCDLAMYRSGYILAFATAVVRRQNLYDEAAMRLVISGTPNPIVNQFKKYVSGDDSQGNLTQVYGMYVTSSTHTIKVQLANTGSGGGLISLYWANIIAFGFEP